MEGVQLPVSNQLLISLQKYGFVGKGAPWHKNKICFVATKNAETKVLREAIFSDAGFKKDFGRGDITSSGKDSASTKARDTHHSVPDSDADESEDELRSLPPKMTAKGSKVGRTWSTATTVLSMAESPVLSASMDHSMVDVIHLEIPASQMGLGCHYDMGGSQESLVISLDGQHSPKKRCKASVVKKTIAVL